MPKGPPQEYIVTYNGYQLPGYAQSENDPTQVNITDNYAFGWDGSISQVGGLSNKSFTMDFKVWEATYRACKDQYHVATAILTSRKDGFAPLFVDYDDRYFEAATKSISYSQTVDNSRYLLTYAAEFDTRPWMTSTVGYTLTGAGTVDTDSVTRTIADGGPTPAHLKVSGTNVTVSGFSATERFTGFVSISGVVTDFEMDTEFSRSYLGTGDNGDGYMYWKDYGLWVGTGKTTFEVTGASAVEITYHNRWY